MNAFTTSLENQLDDLADDIWQASIDWSDVSGFQVDIDLVQITDFNGRNRPAFYEDGSYELEVFISGESIGTFESLEDVEKSLSEAFEA